MYLYNYLVDKYNTERAFSKIKRHPPSQSLNARMPDTKGETNSQNAGQIADTEVDTPSTEQTGTNGRELKAESSTNEPSSW